MTSSSSKIALESKDRLPAKVQDIVCDVSTVLTNIQSSSICETLHNTAKQFASYENTIECTADAIQRLCDVVDGMNSEIITIDEMWVFMNSH